ncbi:hypothetical protein [Mesorhizobium hawassense]|uniref:hypothetical protein n=1 Tax=Mesorhizobium hawassense TaxID=1209954 RepID=UPI0011BEDDB4|nr:hypothetical protein [Mesorhizobium hawassense]
MFKSLSRSTERGGAVKRRLADPCRQPTKQGECLREYIWQPGGSNPPVDPRIDPVSRIDLSPAYGMSGNLKANGECRQDYRIEHPLH